MTRTNPSWQQRKRPLRLERRVELEDYAATRDLLDRVAEVCEREGFYPDISFGRTYVNMTIHAEEGAVEIDAQRSAVARQIDALIDGAVV